MSGIIGACSPVEPPPRAWIKPPGLDRFATAYPNGSQTWRAVFVWKVYWYAADSKRPQTPRNLAGSLSIEAAEVLEHFQFREDVTDKDELGSELADVTLYLLQLASVTGVDLEEAVLKKIKVNQSREWDTEN